MQIEPFSGDPLSGLDYTKLYRNSVAFAARWLWRRDRRDARNLARGFALPPGILAALSTRRQMTKNSARPQLRLQVKVFFPAAILHYSEKRQ